jgi:hypothetical protein
MNRLFIMLVLALATFGIASQVGAQSIPNVRGLEPFSAQTRYMSLVGYLRWQYFTQNNTWISVAEATELVNNQTTGTAPAQ